MGFPILQQTRTWPSSEASRTARRRRRQHRQHQHQTSSLQSMVVMPHEGTFAGQRGWKVAGPLDGPTCCIASTLCKRGINPLAPSNPSVLRHSAWTRNLSQSSSRHRHKPGPPPANSTHHPFLPKHSHKMDTTSSPRTHLKSAISNNPAKKETRPVGPQKR